MKEAYNLTTGSITKKLVAFAMPLLLANVLQALYSMVDMLFVGRMVGENGLAAVSNASMVSFVLNAICLGVTTGGTVMMAQYQGAGDAAGLRKTLAALFYLTLIAASLVTLGALMAYPMVFKLLEVPAGAMADACAYMKIICWGTVFVFGYNAVCAIFKGLGDSKSPLYFILAATVLNIVLDMVLVGPLGTKGAAYATVLAQAVSLLLALGHFRRNNVVFDWRRCLLSIPFKQLEAILRIGVPAALQLVVVNLAYLFMTGMLNQFGVSVAAAAGIGLKINTLAGMPCWAIGQAVTTMVGQNLGARATDRVKAATRAGLRLNLLLTLAVISCVQLLAKPILLLFEPANAEVLAAGLSYLRFCCGLNSLVYAVMYTLDSFALGIGAANLALFNALLDAVFIRCLLSYLLAFDWGWGYMGIYIGQALSPILSALVGAVYFKSQMWEKKRVFAKDEQE